MCLSYYTAITWIQSFNNWICENVLTSRNTITASFACVRGPYSFWPHISVSRFMEFAFEYRALELLGPAPSMFTADLYPVLFVKNMQDVLTRREFISPNFLNACYRPTYVCSSIHVQVMLSDVVSSIVRITPARWIWTMSFIVWSHRYFVFCCWSVGTEQDLHTAHGYMHHLV